MSSAGAGVTVAAEEAEVVAGEEVCCALAKGVTESEINKKNLK